MSDEQGKQATPSESERAGANPSETEQTPATTPTQEPAGQAGQEEEARDLTDRHGQPAIARGKYERDMAAKDEEIAKLRAQIDEAAKTEDGRKELQERIAQMETQLADSKVEHALEMAGCVNVKAARAVLGDYDGDVDKLKSECPYLFAQEKPKTGSTGLPSGGAVSTAEQRRAKARAAAGLKPKKE